MKDLGGRVAVGAAWAMAYKLVERGLGLLSTLILARLLVPEDFGLVAIASAIVALLDMLRFFGFDAALIQHRQPSKAHFDTAWTFAATLGIVTAVLLLLLGPGIARWYDDPRLGPVLWALALAALFNGLESNGPVSFRKELQWKQDFIFQSSRKVAAVIFAIPLAFLWRNYWALVAGTIAGRFASMVISYVITPHRPRFTLSAARDLWAFSQWMLITNVLTFVRQRLPNLLIGKLASAEAVGFFMIARDVTRLPTTEFTSPVNRAAFPGYSKIAGDLPRLRAGYVKLLGAMALIVLPAGIGVAVTAELVVRVCLGERWLAAVPAFQVLGVYGAIGGLQSNSQAVYLAIGRPRLQALMMIAFIAVLLPAVFLLTPRYAHVGAAWAYLIAGLVAVPLDLGTVSRSLGLKPGPLLSVLWRPALATGAMAAALIAIDSALGPPASLAAAAWSLAIEVVSGAGIYLASLTVLWFVARRPLGPERWLFELLRQKMQRGSGPSRATT